MSNIEAYLAAHPEYTVVELLIPEESAWAIDSDGDECIIYADNPDDIWVSYLGDTEEEQYI